MSLLTQNTIEKMIYVIRGQKVMLDSDLAELYRVLTKNLNKAVKRNRDRFPSDFMFQLTQKEFDDLRFQFGTSSYTTKGRRYLPYVFTEYGIVALSGVLNSEVATKVNISIVRTFIKLRKLLASDESLADRIGKLEQGTDKLFRIVFERLDNIDTGIPDHSPKRKRIGLKVDE
ncbi:MAG: ORF6N domain-containing protein [Pseudomonadota bacterium]